MAKQTKKDLTTVTVRGREFYLTFAKKVKKTDFEKLFKTYGFKDEIVKICFHELQEAVKSKEAEKQKIDGY